MQDIIIIAVILVLFFIFFLVAIVKSLHRIEDYLEKNEFLLTEILSNIKDEIKNNEREL